MGLLSGIMVGGDSEIVEAGNRESDPIVQDRSTIATSMRVMTIREPISMTSHYPKSVNGNG